MSGTGMATEFSSLFQSAARLGVLAGSQGLPWAATAPVIEAFTEELDQYLELSIDTETGTLGVMTRGEGLDFTHRAARLMESHGIGEIALRRFLVRAKFFEYRNVFVKVELGTKGLEEFSTYFRRRPTLDVAHAWLAENGVEEEERAVIDDVARLIGARTVHFLATCVTPDGQSADKVYLSANADRARWRSVGDALQRLGVPLASWNLLDMHREAFLDKTVYLSATWRDGQRLPGAKLDVHHITQPQLEAVMRVTGTSPEALERAALLAAMHGGDEVDYAGFRLVPGDQIRTKVYAYRRGEPQL